MRIVSMIIGLAIGGTAAAQDSIEQMMAAGLTEREARMLLGAPTAFAEYRTSYWRVRAKLRRAEYAYAALPVDQTTVREVEVERVYESEAPARDEAQTFPLDER